MERLQNILKSSDKTFLGLALALFIGLFVTYSNHFSNGFQFDDFHTIVNNEFIRDISNIPRFFTDNTTMSTNAGNRSYRPIVATLNARTSILAAANPKLGRFDEFMPMHEQINMPPALLSRFDLIFSIIDKPDRATDTELANHILHSHKAGEVSENIAKVKKSKHSKEQMSKLIHYV